MFKGGLDGGWVWECGGFALVGRYLEEVEGYVAEGGDDVDVECYFWLGHFGWCLGGIRVVKNVLNGEGEGTMSA